MGWVGPLRLLVAASAMLAASFAYAQPGELPIEQPSTFERVIGLKAANALEIAVPPSILRRADRVIE